MDTSTYLLHNASYNNPKPINGHNQNQTQQEQEQEAFNQNLENIITTLPKNKGWRGLHIYNYKGFWASPEIIKGILLISDHFRPQPTDIFLAAFMKCGTTWLKALMFAIANRHRYTSSDHPVLHSGPHSLFPFLDTHIFLDYPVTNFDHLPSPRLFATHLAHSLLPEAMTLPATACRFVYVCRDPKDAFVSKWHFMRKLRSKELPPVSFDEAFELFCNGVSEYGPFWEHVLEYWKASQESPEKVLFLKYEDMKRDPAAEVRKLAAFMGVAFTAEEERRGVVDEIVKMCSFESLSNLEVNKGGGIGQKFTAKVVVDNREFFRKGDVGDWENHLTEEMKDRIDTITGDKLKGSGLVLGATKV